MKIRNKDKLLCKYINGLFNQNKIKTSCIFKQNDRQFISPPVHPLLMKLLNVVCGGTDGAVVSVVSQVLIETDSTQIN